MRRLIRLAAINIGIWAVIAFLFAIQSSSRTGWSQPFGRSLLVALTGFTPYAVLTPAVAMIALRFRFLPGTRAKSAAAHSIGLIAFVLTSGLLMGFVEWIPPGPRRNVALGTAAWDAVFQYVAFDAIIYLLIATVILVLFYARQWQERSVAAAALQGELAEARLHALTSQLQPHFLFNTLNAIAALVRDEPIKAERLLARLSDLLRQVLRDAEHSEVTLDAELQFVEKYAEVQETRFGPRLAVVFDIDPDTLDAKVPPLLLQPIVENAFRHGLGPRAGAGSIQVRARRDGDRLRLAVIDDGSGLPTAGVMDGVGLRTTRARLRHLYGDDYQLTLAGQPAGGTACSIVLPLRRNGRSNSDHA